MSVCPNSDSQGHWLQAGCITADLHEQDSFISVDSELPQVCSSKFYQICVGVVTHRIFI